MYLATLSFIADVKLNGRVYGSYVAMEALSRFAICAC